MIPVALWVPAVLLAIAAGIDVVLRRIPDAFPLLLILWAVVSRVVGFQEPEWVSAMLGLGLGLAIGFAMFSMGWMGGGDGKLLAGLGAVLGPVGLLATLPWMAAIGGVIAVWTLLRRPKQTEIAYGPAVAIGYLLAILV